MSVFDYVVIMRLHALFSTCEYGANGRKESLLSISQVLPIFCKDNANRVPDKINLFIFKMSSGFL